MIFINRDGADPYFSIFFGFFLALVSRYSPISYPGTRDEWVYSEEIIAKKNSTVLIDLIVARLNESSWKLKSRKESEKQLKLEFRLDEMIMGRKENLTVMIQKLNLEWKLTIKSDRGISYKKPEIETLKKNVREAQETIEQIIIH